MLSWKATGTMTTKNILISLASMGGLILAAGCASPPLIRPGAVWPDNRGNPSRGMAAASSSGTAPIIGSVKTGGAAMILIIVTWLVISRLTWRIGYSAIKWAT